MDTLSIAQEGYKEYLGRLDVGQATRKSYQSTIDQFVGFWGPHKFLSTLSARSFELFLEKISEEGLGRQSHTSKASALNSFFGYLGGSHGLDIPKIKVERVPEDKTEEKMTILTEPEIRKIKHVLGNDLRSQAIVDLLLSSGIKVGEIITLALGSFVLQKESGYLNLGDRQLPLKGECLHNFLKYMAVRPKTESKWFFVSESGQPLNIRNLRRQLERYFEKAGFPDLAMFDLRHTFCVNALRNGLSVRDLAKIASHKNLVTTNKYLKYLD